MSYFICRFETNTSISKAFEEILDDLVPIHRKNAAFQIESGSSYLVSYGDNKVIRDIAIRSDNQGSWLVLIGTPLVHFKSKQEEQAFISEFLSNPIESLCNRIDGNFAVFAYDAPRNRLIAATDFNSTIPIFYSITPHGVLFSSHELAIAKFLNSQIDPFGFSQSIHLGTIWLSYTRFKGIHKMLPNQLSIVNDNKELHTEHYWRPQNETIWTGSLEDCMARWNLLAKDSIWKFYECSGQKPVICDFTAGEDSRLIVAYCHAMGIPFKTQVTGLTDNIDVVVAKKAAKETGLELIERRKYGITEEQLLANVFNINLVSDAYQEFFAACTEFATNIGSPLDDYSIVKYCGVPGGEAFRGSYYLRGKAIFPSRRSTLDYKFFTKMKYLLDFHPGLLKFSDDDFIRTIYKIVEDNLEDVRDFPVGTQIDHMLRMFQTCTLGLKYKNPLYLPFATNQMTRSIYSLSPRYKRGGRLTKACTEDLFPELAFIKNQNGVPTIRRTLLRMPLFMPEYFAAINRISSGAVSRLFKWTQANKWYYSLDWNAKIFTTLLNKPPYCNWFLSSQTMITGHMYNPDIVNPILAQAKAGSCRYVPILDRIITQELAFRWVYCEGLS